jgi:hypothetical protein
MGPEALLEMVGHNHPEQQEWLTLGVVAVLAHLTQTMDKLGLLAVQAALA